VSLVQKIEQYPAVDRVDLVDKEDARGQFVRLYGEEMLDAVDSNPLPASLNIHLTPRSQGTGDATALEEILVNLPEVESVSYSQERFAGLEQMRTMLMGAGLFLAVVFLLVLHFIVSNSVKLTIYARKELVVNMRYVGATDLYIALPFLLEGVLQGFLGALGALAALFTLKLFLSSYTIYWGGWYTGLAVTAIGVLFGWWGSRNAVKRFLT